MNDLTKKWIFEHGSYFYIDDVIKFHTVEITENSHWKIFSSNHLFSNFFSKTVTLTKFLPKMRESEFPKFPHCELTSHSVEKWKFQSHQKNSRQINSLVIYSSQRRGSGPKAQTRGVDSFKKNTRSNSDSSWGSVVGAT